MKDAQSIMMGSKAAGAVKALVNFVKDAQVELQKVVWPTRQETVQTTMIVMAMVAIMGILLWMFDMLVTVGIAKLTHLG